MKFLDNPTFLLHTTQKNSAKAQSALMEFTSAILVAVIIPLPIFMRERKDFLRSFKQTRGSLLFLAAYVAVAAGAINAMVFILPYVNTTLLYTFNHAGVMLLSALASHMIFKEKLTRLNALGCAVMCADLICLSLF